MKLQIRACGGMDEADFPRMQALSREADTLVFDAVDGVARDRMTEGRHMHADLMGPARLKHAADMGVALVAGDHLVMGHGVFAQIREYQQIIYSF